MLQIRTSGATTTNQYFPEIIRKPKEDNVAWVKRNVSKRSEQVMLICNYRETATVVVPVGTVITTPHHTADLLDFKSAATATQPCTSYIPCF